MRTDQQRRAAWEAEGSLNEVPWSPEVSGSVARLLDPDAYAENLSLGEDFGVSPQVVDAHKDEFLRTKKTTPVDYVAL